MDKTYRTVGIIGAGNMGEVFAGALVRSETREPSDIYVSDINEDRLNRLKAAYGVVTMNGNADLFINCDVVILAVKPQMMKAVLHDLADAAASGLRLENRKLIISIAAGITIDTIESVLYKTVDRSSLTRLPIIRVMPNTPALVLAGMSAMCGNRNTIAEDLDAANAILASMGKVITVEENEMDMVTALSGSGPAYVFYLVESMMDAGIMLGFDPETAATLTYATLKGAVELLEHQKESPETLRKNVTSPGGTTEAAIRVLEKHRVKETVIEAIKAARERSAELSK